MCTVCLYVFERGAVELMHSTIANVQKLYLRISVLSTHLPRYLRTYRKMSVAKHSQFHICNSIRTIISTSFSYTSVRKQYLHTPRKVCTYKNTNDALRFYDSFAQSGFSPLFHRTCEHANIFALGVGRFSHIK